MPKRLAVPPGEDACEEAFHRRSFPGNPRFDDIALQQCPVPDASSTWGPARAGLFLAALAIGIGHIADAHVVEGAVSEMGNEAVVEQPLAGARDLLRIVEILDREHRLALGRQQLQLGDGRRDRRGLVRLVVFRLAVQDVLLADTIDDGAVGRIAQQRFAILRHDQEASLARAGVRSELTDEGDHQRWRVLLLVLEEFELIDLVEPDAVEPGLDDAVEIAVVARKDGVLPTRLPVAHRVIAAPFGVLAVPPGGREPAEQPAPIPLPVIAVFLRLPDRQIGQHDAPPAVRLALELLEVGGSERLRVGAIARIVDDDHVVRALRDYVGVDALELIAPAFRGRERAREILCLGTCRRRAPERRQQDRERDERAGSAASPTGGCVERDRMSE